MKIGIDEDELEELLDDHQLEIVDIIRTADRMMDLENDPEREAYLEKIHDYANEYLRTFETDKKLYQE